MKYLAFRFGWLMVLGLSTQVKAQQTVPAHFDYSQIDSFALSLRDKSVGDMHQLVKYLTKDYGEEHQKVRVMFRWMTDNIAYDCEEYHQTIKAKPAVKTFSSKTAGSRWVQRKEEKLALKTFRTKKAVCGGYAALFKSLCGIAGIQCEIVTGYTRDNENQNGTLFKKPGHAWNAVRINHTWYLVDATWASGFTDKKVTGFVKLYNLNFYLVPPERFILSHFPDNPHWQLMPVKVSRKQFSAFPLIKEGYAWNKLSWFDPSNGILQGKDSVVFRFKCKTVDNRALQRFSLLIDDAIIPLTYPLGRQGEMYVFHYALHEKGRHVLRISLDGYSTFVYQAIVR